MRTRLIALALLLVAAGCGGDDDGTALAGIYQLSSWTHNPEGCEAEGPEAPEASLNSHFFVRQDSFFGVEFVSAVMCSDLEVCRADAADTDTIHLGGFAFDQGSDGDGWTGSTYILAVGETSCSGQVYQSTLTGEAGDSVRITRESKTVADVPLAADDDCDSEAALAQADERPCEELSVVTGSFLEDI